jgi:hypothetical protein
METPNPVFSRRRDYFFIPLYILAAITLWIALAFIPLGVITLLQRLIAWTFGHFWRQALCTLGLGLIGFALHGFRSRNRLLYGLFEIWVALTGFWYALGAITNPQGAAAAIIAGLYVFVRGIDNYKAGITDQHRRMGLDDQHRPLPKPPT